ncbi:hypothetical protein SSYM_0693, partial [Serratia symbiotica str. Tucson]
PEYRVKSALRLSAVTRYRSDHGKYGKRTLSNPHRRDLYLRNGKAFRTIDAVAHCAITTMESVKRPVGGAWPLHPARITLANKNLSA